jgi:hypothetical protein
MKKIISLIAFISFSAHGAGTGAFHTGSELHQWIEADNRVKENRALSQEDYQFEFQLLGYITGVYDTLDGVSICAPQNVTPGQLIAITKNYLVAHPDQWNFSAEILVARSLYAAFPCKVSK